MANQDYYELLNHGINALNFGTRQNQEYILNKIWEICTPVEREEVYNEIQNLSIIKNDFVTYGTRLLTDECITLNLRFYCNKLWQKIQKEQSNIQLPSYNAISYLSSNSLYFATDVIYQNNDSVLDVAKLLDLVGYGLKFVSIAFDVNTEEFENYNTALKCLNRVLHNDKPQNPLKDLSYILEVLFAIQNHFEQDEEEKRNNKKISLSVSLFIEFLTKI